MNLIYSSLVFLAAVVCVSTKYQCYQCVSSAENQNDCASTDVNILDRFRKECETLEEGTYSGREAKACRKIIQVVGEQKSVIRECAYTGGKLDGLKKTGNWGISLFYYQCENNDDAPCNTTSSHLFFTFSIVFCAFFALFH